MSKEERYLTPILLLIFNRPNETKQVFEAIRTVEPKYLFIAADGPRENNEQDFVKCKLTRDIVTTIDWDCELKTLFREQNLGCGLAPSSAITWFFEHVNEGIILEDDCVPYPTFFQYCSEALEHYRNEPRVMHIAGRNNLPNEIKIKESSYFSGLPHGWGWATWKRAWKEFDYDMKDLNQFVNNDFLASYFKESIIKKHWENILKDIESGQTHIWDYQWAYSVWKNRGLALLPKINLVTNIGFNENATHTKSKFIKEDSQFGIIKFPITFPQKMKINYKADELYCHNYIYQKPTLFDKLKFKIKKILYNKEPR